MRYTQIWLLEKSIVPKLPVAVVITAADSPLSNVNLPSLVADIVRFLPVSPISISPTITGSAEPSIDTVELTVIALANVAFAPVPCATIPSSQLAGSVQTPLSEIQTPSAAKYLWR